MISLALAAAATGIALATLVDRRRFRTLVLRLRSRRLAHGDQAALPMLVEAIAIALRSGLSPELAFAQVAPTLPPPFDGAARRVAAGLRTGESIEVALRALEQAARPADVAPFALVLTSFNRSGGPVGRSLERVAALLRSRIALAEERSAATAQARASSRVLIALPPLGFAFATIVMPDYSTVLFADGLPILIGAVVLEIVGGFWLRRICRPRLPSDELASLLDAVIVGLDAGMTFVQALSQLVARAPRFSDVGARRLLVDLSLGRGSRASFATFAGGGRDRARVAALVQSAVRMGAPLSDLLVMQVDALRQSERRIAEEHARRLPVLMLFPLTLCILPALMLVFLGPAIHSLFA